jgi:hypothetical protein
MREVAWEALALLQHEAEEQMEQLQYHHFPSHAREGVEAVVMPVWDRDYIGCFTDQVKLTRALVQDLDEAIKEVNLLGEHKEESSQKITEPDELDDLGDLYEDRNEGRSDMEEWFPQSSLSNTRHVAWDSPDLGTGFVPFCQILMRIVVLSLFLR